MAFSSATHDIAADGFYMLALDSHRQAMYVGIRSTFYRVATIAGQGLLVILAGWLESSTGLAPLTLDVQAGPQYASETALPSTQHTADTGSGEMHFTATPSVLEISTEADPARVDSVSAWVTRQNIANGFAEAETTASAATPATGSNTPSLNRFERFIRETFGEKREASHHPLSGNIGVVRVCLSQKPDPG